VFLTHIWRKIPQLIPKIKHDIHTLLPVYLVMFIDATLTLVGQPAEYWSEFLQANEAHPVFADILRSGPLLFVYSVFGYAVLMYVIYLIIPRKLRNYIVLFALIAHLIASATWVLRLMEMHYSWDRTIWHWLALAVYLFFSSTIILSYWKPRFITHSEKFKRSWYWLIILTCFNMFVITLTYEKHPQTLTTFLAEFVPFPLLSFFSVYYLVSFLVFYIIAVRLKAKFESFWGLTIYVFLFSFTIMMGMSVILPIYKPLTDYDQSAATVYWYMYLLYMAIASLAAFVVWRKKVILFAQNIFRQFFDGQVSLLRDTKE
jgi:hypothetical protein